MKTIVVPTDFSSISLNAVNYAADMAQALYMNLALLHICANPMVVGEVPVSVYTLGEQVAEAEDQLELLKKELALRSGGSVKISTEVRPGYVVSEILNYCNSLETYAIVMGAESSGVMERFLFGGVTLSAMRASEWPLVIVPPEATFAYIRKIGLSCDFRNVAGTMPVKFLTELIGVFQAELHVIHVSNTQGGQFSEKTVEESGTFHEIMKGLHPKYHFIDGTDIEKEISDYAEKNQIDLLITIPKKHNILSRVFSHSRSERVVLQAHVPVMAIHE